jgi:hypothetical protein
MFSNVGQIILTLIQVRFWNKVGLEVVEKLFGFLQTRAISTRQNTAIRPACRTSNICKLNANMLNMFKIYCLQFFVRIGGRSRLLKKKKIDRM